MSRTPTPTRPRGAPAPAPTRSRVPLIVAGLMAVVVVCALIIALVAGSDSGSDDTATAGRTDSSTDTSAALPKLPDSGADPAIGQALPPLTGTDAGGNPFTIAADGKPQIIVFLAHWCPHCQREVPVIQDWIDGGGLPDGVELASVATAIDERRPNYPPQEWLEREGWTAPVLYDDAASSAAQAAGLSSYPFFVAIDGDGNVVARSSGELSTDRLDAIADQLEELTTN